MALTIFHDSFLEPRCARLTVCSSYPLSKSSHQRLQLSPNSPLHLLVIFFTQMTNNLRRYYIWPCCCLFLLLTFMLQAAVQSHVSPSTLNSSAINILSFFPILIVGLHQPLYLYLMACIVLIHQTSQAQPTARVNDTESYLSLTR